MMARLNTCVGLVVALSVATTMLFGQGWTQWGGTAEHHGYVNEAGQRPAVIYAEIIVDPFSDLHKAGNPGGSLLVHYPAALAVDEDLYVIQKGGTFTGPSTWETQTWRVRSLTRSGDRWVERWTVETDWKPMPRGGPGGGPTMEPLFQPAVSASYVWVPAAGGALLRVSRMTGAVERLVPPVDTGSSIFVAGSPVVDIRSNVFYTIVQLDALQPWARDVRDAWLVQITAGGVMKAVSFELLVSPAPRPTELCTTQFDAAQLPWPPNPDAKAPSAPCGSQRPGVNASPAVGSDGTVYIMSRAHFNDRWAYLTAVGTELTPKWSVSLRNRLADGCGITIPPDGTPGGCRSGSHRGVDPADNELGSGRVRDDATSSPVVTPDGHVLYAAFTRYNYAQGHLMMFSVTGEYVRAYGWGWDFTPAIYPHDGTYSIILKENHYAVGSYCSNPQVCPVQLLIQAEQYYITQLDPLLRVEWRVKSDNDQSCVRRSDGGLTCSRDHPNGFEWCVSGVAVDRDGTVYATSADGHIYAISQGGRVSARLFLKTALIAAYTPVSIASGGLILAQNDGTLFVVGAARKRRAANSF